MIIKVCGIKSENNLQELNQHTDWIGLNFYYPSVRYVTLKPTYYNTIPSTIKKVGVFVNETLDIILDKIESYKLDYVQLHGDESSAFGAVLAKHIKVIKVFRIQTFKDLPEGNHHDYATYYLFDTYTEDYGGSGNSFHWDILDAYKGDIPFLLSGGIGIEHIDTIKNINHPMFRGIDINSKFELEPAIKNMDLIKTFTDQIKVK